MNHSTPEELKQFVERARQMQAGFDRLALPLGFAIAAPADPEKAYRAGGAFGNWLTRLEALLHSSKASFLRLTEAVEHIEKILNRVDDTRREHKVATLIVHYRTGLKRFQQTLLDTAAELGLAIQAIEKERS